MRIVEYGITIATIGDWPIVPVAPEEFQQIKEARRKLLVLLDIEEKFELVIENYTEYERDVLLTAQRHMVRGNGTWTTSMDDLLLLNRRLANLLMAGRLYTDQAKHDTAVLYGKHSTPTHNIEAAFAREYDKALGYRAVEALRNHAQHEALPIHNLDYGPEKVTLNGPPLYDSCSLLSLTCPRCVHPNSSGQF